MGSRTRTTFALGTPIPSWASPVAGSSPAVGRTDHGEASQRVGPPRAETAETVSSLTGPRVVFGVN